MTPYEILFRFMDKDGQDISHLIRRLDDPSEADVNEMTFEEYRTVSEKMIERKRTVRDIHLGWPWEDVLAAEEEDKAASRKAYRLLRARELVRWWKVAEEKAEADFLPEATTSTEPRQPVSISEGSEEAFRKAKAAVENRKQAAFDELREAEEAMEE
ncbi:hypothetical protein BDZ90DRAFT_232997 [Jaminaea rosea]|uniref:Uncharacterized protein n=1 Tax=Jaminaea rosea TaxID=1569628 RepID=A0A316UPK4_9BASI|nr:hypothetical protein BDZ90DRAFT_232997 [Jaminaea rosea]PWN26904.1 hypothetical protein BDZ90DRAFT_232997 [Jaminaea rosea]